jgi:hypothetical protein
MGRALKKQVAMHGPPGAQKLLGTRRGDSYKQKY